MSDLKNYCLTCYGQNDQPKIVYIQKNQALDDKKKIKGCYFSLQA